MTPEKRLQIFMSVEDDLSEIEAAIILTTDRDIRNKMIVQLARIDQKMAELRDRIGFSDCTD